MERKTIAVIGIGLIAAGAVTGKIGNLKSALASSKAETDFWKMSFNNCLRNMNMDQINSAANDLHMNLEFNKIAKNF